MSDGFLDAPEPELLLRLQRNDQLAWKEVFRRYGPSIRKHVLMIIKEPAEVEDVTQEVFLRMYLDISNFNGGTHLLRWAWTTARNQALNDVRDRGNRRRLLAQKMPADEHGPPDPETTAADREAVSRVRDAMATLPEDKREMLTKAAEQGGEEEPVKASPTERSRLSRLRQWLREIVSGGEKSR